VRWSASRKPEPRDELQQRFDDLARRHAELTRWGEPTYDADHLRVWNKNVDFLADPRFCAAYRAGIESDHRLSRDDPDLVDIHIEWRIHVCCWAASHASRLQGDFVECGTNTGIMSLAICHYIDFNKTGKNFYLFDTYAGIPPEQIGPDEAHAIEQNRVYRDCYETAKRNFSPFQRAVLVRGKVPDTLGSQPIEQVCYLMLDMNIVTPEREALSHFWDRLVPGGIVLFDDYGWLGYETQKQAHDEFAARHGVKILNLPTGQGMLLKP